MAFRDSPQKRRERLGAFFSETFGCAPSTFVSSPGRAEIVGNHTDHNLGKVLTAAISCDIVCACAPRTDGTVEIVSPGFGPVSFSVRDLNLRERERGRSVSLARGVLAALSREGYAFGGFSAATQSTVFRGAGVSSSAAFEVLIAEIVNLLFLDGKLTPSEKARAAHFAENTYFGKPCGMLDQTSVAYGGLNKIDFGTKGEPAVERLPAIEGYRLVLVNTGSHSSLTACYADIRREMGEIASCFGKTYLREVPYSAFREALPRLRGRGNDRAILRAFHFFEENARVDRAASALKEGNLPLFLEQVRRSGESSLAFLQNGAVPGELIQPLVLAHKMSEGIADGAFRLMGGGFAGTLLSIVRAGTEEAYGKEMAKVFGKENVFFAKLRREGACEWKI